VIDEGDAMMKGLAFGLVVLAAAPSGLTAAQGTRLHVLPGPTAFPESIGTDSRTGEYFTGSLIDGTVFRGSLGESEGQVFLTPGSDGRTNVAGVKVDDERRIWIADAFNGRVLVYDENGRLLHTFVLGGPGAPTVNDIAFSRGFAYVTDSARPFLYRIEREQAASPGATSVKPWLDVSAAVTYTTGEGPFGVNLNGIVASPDGATLLVVQTNSGMLFRVDVATGAVTRVAVSGSDLLFGDGMLRLGDHLYVARNAADKIAKLKLENGWRTAVAESTLQNRAFAFPTALAALHGRLLIVNSQLNDAASPTLPFTIVDVPLAGS
jgi:hypothetical protein